MPQVLTYRGEKPDGSEKGIAVDEINRLPTEGPHADDMKLHAHEQLDMLVSINEQLHILNLQIKEAFETSVELKEL
jgi:hypothetical protein